MNLSQGQIGAIRYILEEHKDLSKMTLKDYINIDEWFVTGDPHIFVSKCLLLGVGPTFLMVEIYSIENLIFAGLRGLKVDRQLAETTAHAIGCKDLETSVNKIVNFLGL